ncbi:membrane protein [Brevibacillus laterosporus]|nr:membrane protein [Brevibacillus laterosporus]
MKYLLTLIYVIAGKVLLYTYFDPKFFGYTIQYYLSTSIFYLILLGFLVISIRRILKRKVDNDRINILLSLAIFISFCFLSLFIGEYIVKNHMAHPL